MNKKKISKNKFRPQTHALPDFEMPFSHSRTADWVECSHFRQALNAAKNKHRSERFSALSELLMGAYFRETL